MDMEKIQLLIIAGAFGLVPVVILLYWFLTRNKRRELMGHAEVLSKTPELGMGSRWSSGWNYRILFRVGNAEFSLYVLRSDYETITEGMTGILVWQEENMITFTPDQP